MLTRLHENGHAKCAKYWPDETMSEFYGQLIVESMAEHDHGEYVERQLKLTHQRTKKTRDGQFKKYYFLNFKKIFSHPAPVYKMARSWHSV